jgi:hypothetical protein
MRNLLTALGAFLQSLRRDVAGTAVCPFRVMSSDHRLAVGVSSFSISS